MSIKEKEQQLIDEFSQFDDWGDKYMHLMVYGRKLQKYDEKFRDDKYLIQGCQSRVWLHASLDENNKMILQADSDSEITKGIVSLLINLYSGETPDDILLADTVFLSEIGLQEHLTPTRSNGLSSMLKQIRLYALVFKTKLQKQNNG